MKSRSKAREFAVQLFYQAEMTGEDPVEVKEHFWKSFDPQERELMDFAEHLFTSAFGKSHEHETLIKQFLTEKWSYDRLGEMEKCVLKVALDELFYSDTPVYAIMDEYVSLMKKYSDSQTAAFVNGLLENVKNKFPRES